jgi:hypothetical protein
VKLYKPGTLSRVTVARKPDLLESCFGPLGNLKTVHGDRHGGLLLSMAAINSTKQVGEMRSDKRDTKTWTSKT